MSESPPASAMSKSPPASAVTRILAATDRSETASRAVAWAAEMARRYDAELLLLQIVLPGTQPGAQAAGTHIAYATKDLELYAQELAGERGRAKVVVDDNPAAAIVDVAGEEEVDVVVVGNVGMTGRKEFLLGNVPNRVSHNARCTVVIVNTAQPAEEERPGFGRFLRRER
jgi:ubiquinone biosynthesis protein